jgi:hypothetical protein
MKGTLTTSKSFSADKNKLKKVKLEVKYRNVPPKGYGILQKLGKFIIGLPWIGRENLIIII